MKLLNVVHNSKLDTGGKISHNLLMEELKKRGHEISFLSTDQYEGFQTHLMKDYMSIPFLELRERLVQKEIEKILEKEDYDYIYSNGYYSTPPAIKASHKFDTQSIAHFRDYWYAEPNGTFVGDDGEYYEKASIRNIWKHNKKRRFPWNLYKMRYLKSRRKLLNSSDHKIATSREVKRRLNQCGIEDIEVLANPVEIERYQEGKAENFLSSYEIKDSFIASFIGTLSKHKGIQVVEKIIEGMDQDMTFVIAGEGPEKQGLEKKYADHENIVLTGWLDREEIPDLYDASNVILYPSIYPEGFGRIAVESMASGTPIIASNRGGVKHIITEGKTGHLLDPNKTEEWVKKLEELTKDLSTNFTENARKEAQNYTKEKHTNSFKKIIKD